MPYVAPSTVTAGQTYTAAAHNIIVEDVIDHEARINSIEYPFRNLLINGAMQFAQRATSVTGITTGGYRVADRWDSFHILSGTYTHALSADAPTGSGFRNSLRVTCTSAVTSLSANAIYILKQKMEGQTLQQIRKGTSSAQQLTLSFWVKSNKTGTYIAALEDDDNARIVSASYTVSAADTWEKKTITFPADTTGALDNDNNASLSLVFWMVAGTNFTSGTLATTWAANNDANKAVGQTNLAANTNNYIAWTGTQLELGAYATDYAFLPYGDELAQCQRYFYQINGSSSVLYVNIASGFTTNTTGAEVITPFPVTMRAIPSLGSWTSLRLWDSTSAPGVTGLSVNTNFQSQYSAHLTATVAAGLVANRPAILQGNNSASSYVQFNAEL